MVQIVIISARETNALFEVLNSYLNESIEQVFISIDKTTSSRKTNIFTLISVIGDKHAEDEWLINNDGKKTKHLRPKKDKWI